MLRYGRRWRLRCPTICCHPIIWLDALPLTASGKIDQHRLPATLASPQSILGDDASPHPGVENQLAAIWQAVLKTAAVGRHDNFFQLGGDSILSLQVVSRVRWACSSLRATCSANRRWLDWHRWCKACRP
jgi:hypothetical protein